MNLPRVIGLYSPSPQHGKSTVAKYLKQVYGYQIISFATPIKRMTTQFLHGMGYAPSEIDHFLTDGKSARLPGIGVDTRHILQTLGTEWGRSCIHPDVWVQMWEQQAKHVTAMGGRVVCDDVRFINEYRALRHAPENVFWRVTRAEIYDAPGHPSEGFAEDNSNVLIDGQLRNYGTEEELHENINALLKKEAPSVVIT